VLEDFLQGLADQAGIKLREVFIDNLGRDSTNGLDSQRNESMLALRHSQTRTPLAVHFSLIR